MCSLKVTSELYCSKTKEEKQCNRFIWSKRDGEEMKMWADTILVQTMEWSLGLDWKNEERVNTRDRHYGNDLRAAHQRGYHPIVHILRTHHYADQSTFHSSLSESLKVSSSFHITKFNSNAWDTSIPWLFCSRQWCYYGAGSVFDITLRTVKKTYATYMMVSPPFWWLTPHKASFRPFICLCNAPSRALF